MSEKTDDNWVITFFDLFVNGVGSVLLLMVLGVMNARDFGASKKPRPANPDAVPVLVSLSWSKQAPSTGGAGPVGLELRLRKSGEKGPTEVSAQDYQSVRLQGRKAGAEDQAGWLLWFDATPGTTYILDSKVTVDRPIKKSSNSIKDEYEVLVARILTKWQQIAEEPPERAEELFAEARKLGADYTALLDEVDSYRKAWHEKEADWSRSVPSSPAHRHAEVVSTRLALAEGVLKKGLENQWAFPTKSFFTAFDAKPNDRLVVEFESALTRLALAQAVEKESWRCEWVHAQNELLDRNYEFPLELSLAAPGAKELLDAPHRLRNPFVTAASTRPWRQLGIVRVDRTGKVEVEWDGDLKPAQLGRPVDPVAPPAKRLIPPVSNWETAAAPLLGGGADSASGRADMALEFLAKCEKQGDFALAATGGKQGTPTGYTGPGVNGLCLLAFICRGHLVGQSGSRYSDLTKRVVNRLVEALPTVWNGQTPSENLYHHGFATIALAHAYPGLERNDRPLAKKVLDTLEASVSQIVSSQYKDGGWGYVTTEKGGDSSVSCVMVKSMSDALPYLKKESQKAVGRCLERAGQFFEKCGREADGGYVYLLNSPSDYPDTYHRQGGCMLAQHLVRCRNDDPGGPAKYAPKSLEVLLKWQPSSDEAGRNAHFHYGLFYAAHAMTHAPPEEAKKWFDWSRQLFITIGMNGDGDFKGGVYGTAMAVVVLTLPHCHAIERLGR